MSASNHGGHAAIQSHAIEAAARPIQIVGQAVGGAFGSLFEKLAVAYRERRAVTTLRGLDDRTLADIGVSRCGIRHISRKVAENPTLDYRTVAGR